MIFNYIKKYLSKADLKEIAEKIADLESKSSGELRVCIKYKQEWHERKLSFRDLAIKEFQRLGMHKTENKTGVLLLILFKEKKFEIVADEGINFKVEQSVWDKISEDMANHFKLSNFKEGIIYAINEIGDLLSGEFPFSDTMKNELPNEVIIE